MRSHPIQVDTLMNVITPGPNSRKHRRDVLRLRSSQASPGSSPETDDTPIVREAGKGKLTPHSFAAWVKVDDFDVGRSSLIPPRPWTAFLPLFSFVVRHVWIAASLCCRTRLRKGGGTHAMFGSNQMVSEPRCFSAWF